MGRDAYQMYVYTYLLRTQDYELSFGTHNKEALKSLDDNRNFINMIDSFPRKHKANLLNVFFSVDVFGFLFIFGIFSL